MDFGTSVRQCPTSIGARLPELSRTHGASDSTSKTVRRSLQVVSSLLPASGRSPGARPHLQASRVRWSHTHLSIANCKGLPEDKCGGSEAARGPWNRRASYRGAAPKSKPNLARARLLGLGN